MYLDSGRYLTNELCDRCDSLYKKRLFCLKNYFSGTYDARIWHGYERDTPWTWILYIKGSVLDTIRHDMLPILKYPCSIEWDAYM